MSHLHHKLRDESGAALVLVILLALAVTALAVGATMMSGNADAIQRYSSRLSRLEAVADAGLELARSRINGDPSLYPDEGFTAIESDTAVYDADGERIPHVRRTTYVGPSGSTTGQFGVFGSIVTVVEDDFGNRLIRRRDVRQASFAKYAHFSDNFPSDRLGWGRGEAVWGPVHSNSDLRVWDCCDGPKAEFHGPVSTTGRMKGEEHGRFFEGLTEGASEIPMPETSELEKLKRLAREGNTAFTSSSAGDAGEAVLRLEFVAVDLNGDASDGREAGFVRAYRADDGADADWVVASSPGSYQAMNSENCGDWQGGTFLPFPDHPDPGGDHDDNRRQATQNASARCYLGGDEAFNDGAFQATDGKGEWIEWPGATDGDLASIRDDADYLYPLTRALNPNFKGVIHVDGKVALSGTLRSRVTVAATDNIVIADDLTYETDPGSASRTCGEDDMLGLFSGEDILISDNALNTPQRTQGSNWRTFDDRDASTGPHVWVHGVVLALDQWTVENLGSGPDRDDRTLKCEGTWFGRGCLYLTGGVIQKNAWAQGTFSGTGFVERTSYDGCAAQFPPPYFPTTGHFEKGLYYEVNPHEFDVDDYWSEITAGG